MKPTSDAEMASSPRRGGRPAEAEAEAAARLVVLPAPLLAEQEGRAVEEGTEHARPRNVADAERDGDIAAGRRAFFRTG